ncbi:MAG: outer membrane lipoprotein carrier protein LolA [Alphaproteobacteria bacterium]|nr:outer membrane lipoprotein carrier protein LolA [Alphaproteobacteria bacterium]
MIASIKRCGRAAFVALIAALWLASAGGAAAQAKGSAPAGEENLAGIEAYLNSVRTFKGRFLQIAPDGNVSQGSVFMRRPGRMRFQYDPPTPLLIVSDGTWLMIWDKKLDQVDRVPLGSTPIGFLLEREVKLASRVDEASIRREPGFIYLTARDAKQKEDGDITLVFSTAPLELRQWIVTDAQKLQTRVSLFEIETNLPLDIKLFVFTDSGPSVP